MPYVINGARRGGRILAATLAVALIGAAPAQAGDTSASNPDGCVVEHDLSSPFTTWSDFAPYALAPGANFESGTAGWTLTKNAGIGSGNQPYQIVTTADGNSLDLPAGSVATSPPMCIDSTYPHFRLFARKMTTGKSGLKVNVMYLDNKGNLKGTTSGELRTQLNDWALTNAFNIGVTFNPDLYNGAAPVRFQFSAGKDNNWKIDDLYVDPYARR
jgi:hypothetical protein